MGSSKPISKRRSRTARPTENPPHSGWPRLKEGDVVDLILPGFRCEPAAIETAKEFLRSWGLVPRAPKNLLGRHPILANTDEIRIEHLTNALTASDSAAVWCLRGGYGSIRMLPALETLKAPKSPKLFIGFSDVTSLHLFLNQEWGWSTVHGPVLDGFSQKALKGKGRHEREMHDLVFGKRSEIVFDRLKPLNEAARKRRALKGFVGGGNLIVAQTALGTKLHPRTEGQIVFFEDIGERGYRVDRALEHMRQAGVFDRAAAVVFGDFTGSAEPDGRDLVPGVLREFASRSSIPVLKGLPCGHGLVRRPLPFATSATLELGETSSLKCETGCEDPD